MDIIQELSAEFSKRFNNQQTISMLDYLHFVCEYFKEQEMFNFLREVCYINTRGIVNKNFKGDLIAFIIFQIKVFEPSKDALLLVPFIMKIFELPESYFEVVCQRLMYCEKPKDFDYFQTNFMQLTETQEIDINNITFSAEDLYFKYEPTAEANDIINDIIKDVKTLLKTAN